ncbi:GTP 3',8-cyclase MoaA [Entomobacter blattae]|uniref:GTP 3',8-cyclase n=1 Tax=Entomobacter blattae TaxID=2762277 RepID=A0A7H1NTM8_9PROT|nr:GTP 3',8-cyclase MoaA [Entomobacter blattae]QNT79138.1 GTP 3',8-cyclase [Entomobacter blattae]
MNYPFTDPFGRHITYLRISVTDRCDLRCTYCMGKKMSFLPRDELLNFEELSTLSKVFIECGVRKIRLTGGEPLVRADLCAFVQSLTPWLNTDKSKPGLDEITLTTNATLLERYAKPLYQAGIRRINISLDTLRPDRFTAITRVGKLDNTLKGIEAALEAGLKIRINTVVLKGLNDDEFDHLIEWCGQNQMDLCLIETMPMGQVEGNRMDHYLPLAEVKNTLQKSWTLLPTTHSTSGPARYMTLLETGQKIGFITPLSHGFCEACNRVRLSCTGVLYTCLGQENNYDFRTLLRSHASSDELKQALFTAIQHKPRGHDFAFDRLNKTTQGQIKRHMNVTGG